jgi:hypothetical protein
MEVATIISTWEGIIQQFFTVFTVPTANLFLELVTGWVLCTGRRTITGILPFADPQARRAHDAYHRFFPDSSWAMSEVWRRLTLLLVRVFWPDGTIHLDLDDTVHHRSGRKVSGAGWWRDAVRSTGTRVVYAWGLNIVVLTLRIYPRWGGEPLGLPINMRLHRKDGPLLPQLAHQMLIEVASWLPKRRFQCHGDGFFVCLAGRRVPNIHIISRMRRDAKIYDLVAENTVKKRGRPRKRGKKLPAPQHMAKHIRNWRPVDTIERGKMRKRLVYSREVIWYAVSEKPVLLVISRDPEGKEKDDFFVTTDLDLSCTEVISGFAGRWSIEDTFKNNKQFLGGQEPQTWKDKGPERAAALSLWLYSVVWLWYLQRKNAWRSFKVVPWYPAKRHPSFQDALSTLRRTLWTKRIKSMFGKSAIHDKNTEFLILALSKAA